MHSLPTYFCNPCDKHLQALRIAIRTDVSSYTKLLLTISAQAHVGYVSVVYDVGEIERYVHERVYVHHYL